MVHVVATINLNEGCLEKFLEIVKANIPNVLKENGCISYEPTMDADNWLNENSSPKRKNTVVIVEKWQSMEELENHIEAPHMKSYREKVKGMVNNVELQILTDV